MWWGADITTPRMGPPNGSSRLSNVQETTRATAASVNLPGLTHLRGSDFPKTVNVHAVCAKHSHVAGESPSIKHTDHPAVGRIRITLSGNPEVSKYPQAGSSLRMSRRLRVRWTGALSHLTAVWIQNPGEGWVAAGAMGSGLHLGPGCPLAGACPLPDTPRQPTQRIGTSFPESHRPGQQK